MISEIPVRGSTFFKITSLVPNEVVLIPDDSFTVVMAYFVAQPSGDDC